MDERKRPASDQPESGAYGIPPPADCLTEFLGTAILLAVGLSAVVLLFSTHSPVVARSGDPEVRRLLAGACFVTTAALIIYSPLGQRGGGHLNPALTIGFLRLGKLRWQGAVIYVGAQLSGALAGSGLVLLLWGSWARSVHLGASTPGRFGAWAALGAEVVLTFLLVSVVFHCVDRPRFMR